LHASGHSESPFPALEALSRKTLLLRIPSFEGKYRDALAHLIGEKRGELMDHEDWIVAVRGNQGGSDSTYEALLPWLLADEYEDAGAKWLVTPANIEGQRNLCRLMAPGDRVCESYSAQAIQRMEGAAAGTYVSQNRVPRSTTGVSPIRSLSAGRNASPSCSTRVAARAGAPVVQITDGSLRGSNLGDVEGKPS